MMRMSFLIEPIRRRYRALWSARFTIEEGEMLQARKSLALMGLTERTMNCAESKKLRVPTRMPSTLV